MQKKKPVILFISIIMLLFIIVFVYVFRSKISRILSPIFLGFAIAYLVNPLVKKLQRKKIPSSASIILVYLFLILSFIAITIYIIPELINNTKELIVIVPEMVSSYQEFVNNILSNIRSNNWSLDIKDIIFNEIDAAAIIIQNYIVNILKNITSKLVNSIRFIVNFILALVIAFYFIRDSQYFRSNILSLTPKKWRKNILQAGRDINEVLSNFIGGQLLTALIVGVLEFVGLILVRVKYPMVLGILGGISNIIPYFGPLIGAVPAIAVALLDSPQKALWTAIVFIVVQQIDNALICPKIIQGKVGLHPVITLITVLAGGEFFGITGMMLAVPSVAIIKALLKRTVEEIV